MISTFDRQRNDVAEFCRKNSIHRLALFGSVLRPDFSPESDIDILVEFQSGTPVSFLTLARLERELSALFGGRRVDLHTPQDLSRYFRNKVVSEAYVLHGSS